MWMAKFPSKHDEINVGAWEMVVHDLAVMCNLNVPEARLENFSKQQKVLLLKRIYLNCGAELYIIWQSQTQMTI